MDPKVAVVILCHNQDHIVNLNIRELTFDEGNRFDKTIPNNIIVVNDNSELFNVKNSGIVEVVNTTEKHRGRSCGRNLGIKKALDYGADIIVFMDGDTVPLIQDNYIRDHLSHYLECKVPRMVFGLRNMVSKIKNTFGEYAIASTEPNPKEEEDPRLVSEIYPRFNNLTDFNEKVNFIMTGWVTWTCNFSANRKALNAIWKLNKEISGKGYWFDEIYTGWGFEDNAFGLDAMYAGVDIRIDKLATVQHLIHKSEYTQLKQVLGSSMIFNRFRKLEEYKRSQNETKKWIRKYKTSFSL